jgi:prepilin-type N-terminal cleavage/methylation domain-containing protein
MQVKMIYKKGFTLVELLVAVSIMATLMAILVPNLMGSRQRARDAKKIEDLGSVKNGLRFYYDDNQTYPAGSGVSNLSSELEEYIPGIAGVGYTYYQTNNGDGFALTTYLEVGAGDSDIESQSKCNINPVNGAVLGVGETADRWFVVCAN